MPSLPPDDLEQLLPMLMGVGLCVLAAYALCAFLTCILSLY